MSQQIRIRREPGSAIGCITLHLVSAGGRFSMESVSALTAALTQLSGDDDIKVIVIDAAGDDLSQGFDPAELESIYREAPGGRAGKIPSQRARLLALNALWWGLDGLYTSLLRCPKVTVLAANGACQEAGLYMALCCDVVIASDTARFGNRRWQHVGVDGDISMLVAAVGLKRAKELMYFGLEWNAQQARDYGLVDEVVARDELPQAVAQVAAVCSQVMRDGIAAEKHVVFASLEKMHIGMGFATANVVGAWASNVHFREGEFNLLRQARAHGMSEALQQARAYFDHG